VAAVEKLCFSPAGRVLTPPQLKLNTKSRKTLNISCLDKAEDTETVQTGISTAG